MLFDTNLLLGQSFVVKNKHVLLMNKAKLKIEIVLKQFQRKNQIRYIVNLDSNKMQVLELKINFLDYFLSEFAKFL